MGVSAILKMYYCCKRKPGAHKMPLLCCLCWFRIEVEGADKMEEVIRMRHQELIDETNEDYPELSPPLAMDWVDPPP